MNLLQEVQTIGFTGVAAFSAATGVPYSTLQNWRDACPQKVEHLLKKHGKKNIADDAPSDATHLNTETSTFYKIGAHGFVYMFDDVSWIRSAKQISELNKMLTVQ